MPFCENCPSGSFKCVPIKPVYPPCLIGGSFFVAELCKVKTIAFLLRRCGGILILIPRGSQPDHVNVVCVWGKKFTDFFQPLRLFCRQVSPVSFPREYRLRSDGRIHPNTSPFMRILAPSFFAVSKSRVNKSLSNPDSSACKGLKQEYAELFRVCPSCFVLMPEGMRFQIMPLLF